MHLDVFCVCILFFPDLFYFMLLLEDIRLTRVKTNVILYMVAFYTFKYINSICWALENYKL